MACRPLTPREIQVRDLLYKGMSYADIARQLDISQKTAECHATNLLNKLGFTSTRRLMAARIAELEA